MEMSEKIATNKLLYWDFQRNCLLSQFGIKPISKQAEP